ncbi:MAG: hypothetical protein K5829_05950 [Treponema sp.]|nr:hypothetical protein [Treponema sp.]
MKPNIFLIILSVLISALAGYGFYAANPDEAFRLLLTIGSALCLAVTLTGTLGIKFESKSGNINFRLVSLIFFIIFLISNIIFGIAGVKQAPYIIINGIFLLIYAIVEYGIIRANK